MITLMLLMALGTSQAGDVPYRCEAVWIQPTKLCPLESTWAATGTGSSEVRAHNAALERMRELVASAALVQTTQAPKRPVDSENCRSEVDGHVRMSCLPAPELVDSRTCYIDFPAEGCGGVAMFERKGPPWRVMEKGRRQICDKVDETLRRADLLTRHQCRAACLNDARVRCPM